MSPSNETRAESRGMPTHHSVLIEFVKMVRSLTGSFVIQLASCNGSPSSTVSRSYGRKFAFPQFRASSRAKQSGIYYNCRACFACLTNRAPHEAADCLRTPVRLKPPVSSKAWLCVGPHRLASSRTSTLSRTTLCLCPAGRARSLRRHVLDERSMSSILRGLAIWTAYGIPTLASVVPTVALSQPKARGCYGTQAHQQ